MKKNFFLSVFILLTIFKTPYIAIFSEYFNLESTPIAIVVRILMIIFAVILFFLQKKILIHNNYFYIMLLFLIALIVIVFQLQPDYKVDNYKSNFYYLGYAFSIISVISVLYACQKNLKDLSESIFYILIFFSISTLLLGSSEINNRHQLLSLNPISIGYFSGVLIIISFWRLFFLKNKRLISVIGIIISLYLLFMANSKSPILGVLFASWFLFIRSYKYYLLIFLLFIIFTLFINLADFNVTNTRLLKFNEPGIDIRMLIYESYFDAIKRNFILPPMDPVMNLIGAHNIFLAFYSGTGIFGLIIFLYLIYFTFRASYKLIYYKSPYAWIGSVFVLTLIISLFSGAILDEFFWIILSLVNVYYFKELKENNFSK
jgi:hypothetical protein